MSIAIMRATLGDITTTAVKITCMCRMQLLIHRWIAAVHYPHYAARPSA